MKDSSGGENLNSRSVEAENAEPVVSGPADAELISRIGRGDESAFSLLLDRHGDALFRLAMSQVGNVADAEDVLQEALAGAFSGAGKFQGRSAVKTWLMRIVITQAALFQRKARRHRGRSEMPAGIPATSGGISALEAKMDLNAALQRLSPEHRQVLALREFEQLSYSQMAEVLDLPVGTVESRLFRARTELKAVLKDYGVA